MENLFYQPEISNGIVNLDADESRHCVKVLRKKSGDIISITDGRGRFYNAHLIDTNPVRCLFDIQSVIDCPKKNYTIHLAISPTKNTDRIEWMVEKCVEIGVDEITLLHCRKTERKVFKIGRIEKIAISAMKQSKRAWLPTINQLTPFQEFMKHVDSQASRYIAHVDHSNSTHLQSVAKRDGSYVVLIGPEGDFSTEELELAAQNNFVKVSLGNYRLRTETAGLMACQVLNLVNI